MATNSPDLQRGIQLATTGLSAVTLGALMVWVNRNRDRWYYSIPPAFWLLHVVIFYANLLIEDAGVYIMPHPEFTFWSSLVRLHAVATIAGVVAAFLLNWIKPYKKLL